jgi:hypothetical protein
VLGEGLEIRARLVVEALEMGVGDQLKEVLVTGEVAAEQAEVVDGFALVGAAGAVEAGSSAR